VDISGPSPCYHALSSSTKGTIALSITMSHDYEEYDYEEYDEAADSRRSSFAVDGNGRSHRRRSMYRRGSNISEYVSSQARHKYDGANYNGAAQAS
jgi:hypothetical protein